jgi:hypothetical protein
MDHPPYSSDLALCEFLLFTELKKMPGRDKDMLPEMDFQDCSW